MREVVVTGYGIVSCLGNDIGAVTESLKNSNSGITINEINKELGLRSYISGSITDLNLKEKIDICKERCGLENLGLRLINNLSKGYKQRVGLAQAIVHTPSIIILDEPTSGLDPKQILEIRELMHELSKNHSIILSTHILSEVETICDRVLIINKGNIVLDQHLKDLLSNKNSLEKTFLHLTENNKKINE